MADEVEDPPMAAEQRAYADAHWGEGRWQRHHCPENDGVVCLHSLAYHHPAGKDRP